MRVCSVLLVFVVLIGCEAPPAPPELPVERTEGHAAAALGGLLAPIEAWAEEADEALEPLALLRFPEQAALRQFSNQVQLERAVALGVSDAATAAARQRHLDAGRLVRLADSTRYWVVRELDHSYPLVTPDVEVLLTRLGERFHAALAEHGLPPLRMEITSVLRTPDLQADLRATNANAARGRSTHEFGTTIDVAYSSFAAPERAAPDSLMARWDPALRPLGQKLAALALERVAAQRSREVQAILGRVLIALQQEGVVMVTLEELQPVYHMTVARRLSAAG